MIRGDLSNRLIHLTRRTETQRAEDIFKEIVRSKKLIGSGKDTRGAHKCVCFTEAPLTTLTHALASREINGMRYEPFGVMVSKEWLFDMGGRPVIYQTNEEYDLLPEALQYRHVRYEPSNRKDYTWEREWRIKTEELVLDPAHITLIVPLRANADEFHQQHANDTKALSVALGDIAGFMHEKLPWHFIALEDIGVDFE